MQTTKPKQQSIPQKADRFKCKWRACRTKLHNLETLRRHVLKVHRPNIEELSEGGIGYVCWFKKCKYLVEDGDNNFTSIKAFQNLEEWTQHIQDEHIYPVAMKYGDGPRTRSIGKPSHGLDLSRYLYNPDQAQARTFSPTDLVQIARDKQRYLSDQSGRTTTPNLSEQYNRDLRADTLNLTEVCLGEPRTLKEEADLMARESFFKSHGIAKDLKKQSEEVIRAMAVRKEKIGPGIERGGCTLINDERRATFVQNPGIRRVVDIDY